MSVQKSWRRQPVPGKLEAIGGDSSRPAPRKDYEVNQPEQIAKVLDQCEAIRDDRLRGGAAIEKAAKDAGIDVIREVSSACGG